MRVIFPSTYQIDRPWEEVRDALASDLQSLAATINRCWDVSHNVDGTQKAAAFGTTLGQASGTLANQPGGLSVVNDGLLFFVSDFGHLVRWDGAAGVWRFAPGDVGNGFFRDFGITPQDVGWQLCNGTVTTYLVVGGASLTTATFTTPNLTGHYRKSAGTYAGLAGATAPGASASPPVISGSTAVATDTFSDTPGINTTGAASFTDYAPAANQQKHFHTGTTDGHAHGAGSLAASAPSVSVDASGEPAHLSVATYFRR